MDNVKYYSDNLAHDFDMFMPKPKQQTSKIEKPEKVVSMPKARPRNKAVSSKASKTFTIVLTVFMAAAIIGNISLRAKISEVSAEINKAETIGEELKSEQTRLSVELEKKTTVGNLEKQAKAIGMQKQEKAQMNYIFSYEDDETKETANK